MVRAVCVDVDARRRARTADALERTGLEVCQASTVVGAERILLESASVECVVAEHDLPDGTGLDLFDRVRRLAPDAACVLFSDVDGRDVRTPACGEPVVEHVDASRPRAHERLRRRVVAAVDRRSHAAYPVPTDESERLSALDRLDLPSLGGPDLDRLAALAVERLDAPVALVGIVEAHHERFLAARGVPWRTLHRQDTVCTHAVCREGPTTVEDLAADPRFGRSPVVRERGLRSYAGVPLRAPDGAVIGVFCVLDEQPRSFTEADLDDLQRLADEALRCLLEEPTDQGVEA